MITFCDIIFGKVPAHGNLHLPEAMVIGEFGFVSIGTDCLGNFNLQTKQITLQNAIFSLPYPIWVVVSGTQLQFTLNYYNQFLLQSKTALLLKGTIQGFY